MRRGWGLLRPDLVLWVALACLIAVATMSMPAGGDEPPPALPFFVMVVSGLLTSMLPAVLFTAQVEGRQLSWAPVLLLMARKAAPLVFYALTAFFLASAANTAMLLATTAAVGNTPMLIPSSTIAGAVIFLSIIVRYSYLPFLVILLERDKVPPALWQWQRMPQAAPLFWPLTASARLTEGSRWSLAFYTSLEFALPFAATVAPAAFMLPVSVLAQLFAWAVQGVFFLKYLHRCEVASLPAPTLPLENPVEA
jgi:hypothetical protein